MGRLSPIEARRFLIERPRSLGAMNVGLGAVFASRAVYELLTLYAVWYLPDLPLQRNKDLDPRCAPACATIAACMALRHSVGCAPFTSNCFRLAQAVSARVIFLRQLP